MSRVAYIASSLLLMIGAVAALVRAQDTPGFPPAQGHTPPPATGTGGDVRLVQHLQSVGQSITAEYHSSPPSGGAMRLNPPVGLDRGEPGLLLAANEAPAGSELRSVLTRRATAGGGQPGAAAAPPVASPPAVSGPPATLLNPPAAAPSTAAVAAEPAATVAARPMEQAPREPALLQMQAPGDAPAAGVSDNPERSPPAGNRTSSRRTFQDSDGGSSVPPLVASKPVAGGGAGAGQLPAGASAHDTLSSTTGALLRVTTVGPSALTLGLAGQIAVRLTNLGSTDAHGAEVRVAIPPGLEMVAAEVDDGSTRIEREANTALLIWSIDHVPARADRILNLKAVARSAEPVALAVDWSVAPLSSVAQIPIQEPRLELALRGPGHLAFGETKVYTVIVSNPGTGEAQEVTLRLSLGDQAADTLPVGTIAAGGRREFDVEVTPRQAGPMLIAAAAVGALGLKAEAQEQVQVRRADLQIQAIGSAAKYTGSVGTYQVRVANAGDAAAEELQASVRLPLGTKYVQGLDSPSQEGTELKWPVGPLGPGEERTYRFFCQLGEEGEARFDFVIRGGAGLQAAASVLTQVQAIADLKMTIDDPQGPVAIGQEAVWEIQLTNHGTKAATQVQIIAQFSEGVEPLSAAGARAELVPGQVVFQPIARLNPGETVKLTIRAKGERDGNHLFRAELRCTDPEYRVVAEDTTTFYGDELMASPVQPPAADPAASRAPRTGAANGQPASRQAGWMAK
jgi:uncharacterized repeat protein (TIGR01451 family)